MGIDYGMGQTNIDIDTGIRFGVINQNKLDPWGLEDVYQNGEDLDFSDFKEQLKSDLESAIERVLDEYNMERCNDSKGIADDIIDGLQFDNYEGNGDNPRYLYECDGYKIETCSDGDWFILKSPYYTRCDFCSPCAPGAGYLTSEGDVKTYCLGPEWFEDDKPPYNVFSVADDCLLFSKGSE